MELSTASKQKVAVVLTSAAVLAVVCVQQRYCVSFYDSNLHPMCLRVMNRWFRGGRDIQGKYCLGHKISDGQFGQVFAATLADDSTQRRAIKHVRQEHARDLGGERLLIFQQAQLLRDLSHENIVKFHDILEGPAFVYIVMEMCDGGDLFAELLERGRFSESQAAQFGGHMVLALKYIHSRHVVHRDVRAENFMLTAPGAWPVIKLVDFGMACRFTPGRAMTELCGSPHYLAPEMLYGSYDCLIDMWAFGVLQFLLLHGRYPFGGDSSSDILREIVCDPMQWKTTAGISADCMDFLERVLTFPNSRLSAQDALEHMWMRMTDADIPSDEEYL